MIDDNIEQALRIALDAQARRIEVAPDALTKIRARTRKRRRTHRGGFMVTLSTGTGVLAATAVFAFASVTGGCQSKPVATHPPAGSARHHTGHHTGTAVRQRAGRHGHR